MRCQLFQTFLIVGMFFGRKTIHTRMIVGTMVLSPITMDVPKMELIPQNAKAVTGMLRMKATMWEPMMSPSFLPLVMVLSVLGCVSFFMILI